MNRCRDGSRLDSLFTDENVCHLAYFKICHLADANPRLPSYAKGTRGLERAIKEDLR